MNVLNPASAVGRLYLALVTHPRSTLVELEDATGLPTAQIRSHLAALAAAGLARQENDDHAERWEPESPDLGLDRVLDAEEERLMDARSVNRQLDRLFWMARRGDSRYASLEIVRGESHLAKRYAALMAGARHQVRACVRPPFVNSAARREVDIAEQAQQVLHGIEHRTVWWGGLYADTTISHAARQMAANGEQSRVFPGDLALKTTIADDQRALVYLDTDDADVATHLIVYPSGLLNLLIRLFESYWAMSVPMATIAAPRPGSVLADTRDRTVLEMLASGATDTAIARRLGVSERTVLRLTAELTRRLGAKTRFQTGVEAVRQGLIT